MNVFHLIGFWLFGKVPWRSMDYGLNLKLGIAYATTNMPLPNKAMKRALLLPFWTTGVLPMLLGYVRGITKFDIIRSLVNRWSSWRFCYV